MATRRRTALVLSAALLVLMGCGSTSAHEGSATPRPATSKEAYELHLRAEFGFDHDLSLVRRLHDEGRPDDPLLQIPLTSAESAEMQRRNRISQRIIRIDHLEHGDATYAGTWLDQKAGGVVDVAFTRPPSSATVAAITDALPPDTKTVVRTASVSLARLNELERRVGNDWLDWKARGVRIAGSDVDVIANQTVVYVTSNLADARAQLDAAYGEQGLVVSAPTGPTELQ